MVTVVDPNGTPVPVYTRSGTTIQTINGIGDTGSSPENVAQIVAVTGWTVVIVNITTVGGVQQRAVRLPPNAEIGDLVEIHQKGPSAIIVFPPDGEHFDDQPANDYTPVQSSCGRLFRKVASDNWRAIAPPSF